VDTLKDAQAGITGQLNALQSQVDKANLLAEARAASTTIQDLITGQYLPQIGGIPKPAAEPGCWLTYTGSMCYGRVCPRSDLQPWPHVPSRRPEHHLVCFVCSWAC
jgi:hypothetical protein